MALCIAVLAVADSGRTAAAEKPSLIVVVSVDQLCYEYLERFGSNFGETGLVRKVQSGGVWYSNCMHQHAFTFTGPGHSVQLTGCYPNRSGIIGNSWFDRRTGSKLYCVSDPESRLIGAETTDKPVSPKLMICDTVGDQLKLATGGKSRVFTVAIKDRAAILMAGRMADAAIWMSNQGDWITSSHYGRVLPDSMMELNASRHSRKFAGRTWELMHKPSRYLHGATEVSEAERPMYDMTADFPHALPAADHENYIRNLACSPFGNEVTLEAARALIEGEGLGTDEYPDILGINLSPNDYVGHSFGPQSLEVEDMTYRTDALLGEFIDYLDQRLGGRRFVLFVTADHGVAPIPELAAKQKLLAARDPLGREDYDTMNIPEMQSQLEKHLTTTLGFTSSNDDAPQMVTAFVSNGVYLNHSHPAIIAAGLDHVSRVTRDWVLSHPVIVAAMTREELLRDVGPDDELRSLMRRSYHPGRAGDVLFVMKPFHFQSSAASTHGSPWHYDRHVPLLVIGDVEPATSSRLVSPASIATTIARLLHVEAPSMAEAPPLDEVRVSRFARPFNRGRSRLYSRSE